MKRKALFVGIDRYKNDINQLRCACNDAKELSFAFSRAGYKADLLLNEEATQNNIISKVRTMTKDLQDDDIFVFYFSGHGAEHNGAHYLLGVEADSNPELFNIGSVTIGNLTEITRQCPGIKKLFILDCCRASLLASRSINYTCSEKRAECLNKAIQTSGAAVIPPLILTSCSTGEVAYENIEIGHGYFTKVLLDSIENKNIYSFEQFRKSLEIEGTPHPQNVSWNGNINKWENVPLFSSWEISGAGNSREQVTSYPKPAAASYIKNINIEKLIADAAKGSTDAEYKLGELYLHGIGVEENWHEAYKLSLRAAIKGHLLAQFNTALCLYEGRGVKKDISKAEESFSRIKNALHREEKKGNPEYKYALSYMYFYGLGVEEDEEISFRFISQAAEQKLPQALHECAQCYANGWGVDENPDKAFDFYRKAAEAKVYPAYSDLAYCYEKGLGVGKNSVAADEYYQKAADYAGYWGKMNLAWWLIDKDEKKSDELIRSCMKNLKADADNDELERMWCYAWYLRPEDSVKAFTYFKRGADQEDENSMIELAKCYYEGIGTAKDQQKAIEILQGEVLEDNSEAQDLLAEWIAACNRYADSVEYEDDSNEYVDCSCISMEDEFQERVKNIIKKYRNKNANLCDNQKITSICQNFIDIYNPLLFGVLLGGYYRNTKRNCQHMRYEFFAVYSKGLYFGNKFIRWIDITSVNSEQDGILINKRKLRISERIGTIADLIRKIRDLYMECFPELFEK